MITLFGASTDIGSRLAHRLQSAGIKYRPVSRRMPGAFSADLSTGQRVCEALSGSDVVVSCAHAKFTETILRSAPLGTTLILIGSAWRYSTVPNERADLVRSAEKAFLDQGNLRGVMLHPTMIYGGFQENNVQRLLSVIRRFPIIPAPGGGRQIVCPIYIDDVVDCIFNAATLNWDNASAMAIAGPPLTWRQMVALCAETIGLKRAIVPVPLAPAISLLEIARKTGLELPDPNILRRFREDVRISLDPMKERLAVNPRSFDAGIRSAVQGWQLNEST